MTVELNRSLPDAAGPAGAGQTGPVRAAVIDAAGKHYRELNGEIRAALIAGAGRVEVRNVAGQRYLGCGLTGAGQIVIRGTPGNDLAAFMDGPEIVVHGNAQDGVGNTMNAGRVAIHGDAGDVLAHSMRGGTILVKGSVGYRAGIHMKSYAEKQPVVVIGGAARDYLGEYMAGGLLVVLGLGRPPGRLISGRFTGTGMHGGKMLLGDDLDEHLLGREVGKSALDQDDWVELRRHVEEYVAAFGGDAGELLARRFIRLLPVSRRPYGQIYVY
jgi:glutamate synthase domain-containing protein 3